MPAVCSVGCGAWYGRGVARMEESIRRLSPDIDVEAWVDVYPPNSPPHQEIPYAFKFHAMREAGRKHSMILWLDASIWAVKPIDPIFDYLDGSESGVALWRGGWTTGEWTKDEALERLGITREESFGIPLMVGGVFGLNLKRPVAREFLDKMLEYANDGVTFPGAWSNTGEFSGACSADSRVLGHRHDMPPMSVLAHRMGIPAIDCPKWFAYWSENPDPQTLLLARGGA